MHRGGRRGPAAKKNKTETKKGEVGRRKGGRIGRYRKGKGGREEGGKKREEINLIGAVIEVSCLLNFLDTQFNNFPSLFKLV